MIPETPPFMTSKVPALPLHEDVVERPPPKPTVPPSKSTLVEEVDVLLQQHIHTALPPPTKATPDGVMIPGRFVFS